MGKPVRHIAGEMIDNVQSCVICGLVLFDYRNAMFPPGQEPPKGWTPGPIYIQGKNPTVFRTSLDDDEEFIECSDIK